jgi:hypothetical protein
MEVAKLLNAAPSSITDWFAGRRCPSLDDGYAIEALLAKQRRKKPKPKAQPRGRRL